MSQVDSAEQAETALRVRAPIAASFTAGTFVVNDFAVDLSESGIFLPTKKMCERSTQGTLKLRATRFDDALELKAVVTRTVAPGDEDESQPHAGLGIRFLQPTPADIERLHAIVEGVRSGSVVESIRRSAREANRPLLDELRGRSTDQKLMLAVSAKDQEIRALIRDGHPSVQLRLLESPRLSSVHILMMLRNPNLPTQVLSAIKRGKKWMANQEVRFMFCTHQGTILAESIDQLRHLPADKIHRLTTMPQLRPQIRARAQELSRER